MLQVERWGVVEQNPTKKRGAVHGDEDIVESSPANLRIQQECITDRWSESGSRESGQVAETVSCEAVLHRYKLAHEIIV